MVVGQGGSEVVGWGFDVHLVRWNPWRLHQFHAAASIFDPNIDARK